MIAVIDNYDSFVFNLVQALGWMGEEIRVFRNDAIDVNGLRQLRPDALVLSPGPGRPEDAGVKAYQLLMKAMEESGYGAIAKLTMHQREHIVIVRPGTRGMTLHTMFYSNEIRAAESVPTDKIEIKDQEKKLAQQLIESLAAPFEPQKYRDEYQENLRAMISAKLKGQQVTEVAQPHLAPVIDLMEALKKSLDAVSARKKTPAKAAVAKPAAKRKRA